MIFRSIKLRVSFFYTFILILLLTAHSAFLYFSLHTALSRELDKNLETRATALGQTIRQAWKTEADFQDEPTTTAAGEPTAWQADLREYLANRNKREVLRLFPRMGFLESPDTYTRILDAEGNMVAKSKNLDDAREKLFPGQLHGKVGVTVLYEEIRVQNDNLRVINAPLYENSTLLFTVQMAASRTAMEGLLKKSRWYFIISILVFALLTALVGILLVRSALQYVVEITQTVQKISHEDLKARLPERQTDEELRGLVLAFNDMISRLERAFEHIAEFSSHVAHELKTPIAIIRGEVELCLRKDRDIPEYKRVLEESLEECRRMLKTVDDLLLLAKLDFRPEIYKFDVFDLRAFFREIFEQALILAQEKKIEVTLREPTVAVFYKGDALHLRRLFFNILHNAIKFTPPEGKISLELERRPQEVTVHVRDSGIGIPEQDLPRVFDRFFHIDRTGENAQAGNGLGLSIALSIAKAHQGAMQIQSRPGEGTLVTVRLPIPHLI